MELIVMDSIAGAGALREVLQGQGQFVDILIGFVAGIFATIICQKIAR